MDPTALSNLQSTPRPHLRQTRNNTPGIINGEPQTQPSKHPRTEQPNSEGDQPTSEGAQAITEGETQHFFDAIDTDKEIPLIHLEPEP
jgi:hypothetical protein